MKWEVTAVKGESLEIFEYDKFRLISSHSKDRFQVIYTSDENSCKPAGIYTVSELILHRANY